MSLDGLQIFVPEFFSFFQELIVKDYGFPIQGFCCFDHLLFRTKEPHFPCFDTVSCFHGISFCCQVSLNIFISHRPKKTYFTAILKNTIDISLCQGVPKVCSMLIMSLFKLDMQHSCIKKRINRLRIIEI